MSADNFPATQSEIVNHWLILLAEEGWDRLQEVNWMTGGSNTYWAIPDTDTYINGVVMNIDLDYHTGWLLEVVDRSTSLVNFVAVVTFHGPRFSDGNFVSWRHDSSMFPTTGAGITFFDRTVDHEQACIWGVQSIFGMIDAENALKERESNT